MRDRKLLTGLAMVLAILATTLVATPAQAAPPWNSGWYRIIAFHGGCLGVPGNVLHTEARVMDCTTLSNDTFFRPEVVASSGGYYYYRFRKWGSDLCLYANGTATGARIKQYSCASYLDQQWLKIYRAAVEIYQLKNRNSGKCIVSQANVMQVGCATSSQNWTDQFWTVLHYGD